MKFIYEGVDITSSIDIRDCVHDMHAAGQADTLRITIDDEKKKWDKWGAKEGDSVRLVSDSVDTGTMYVSRMRFKDGALELTASSVPAAMFDKKSKTWNEVTFLRMARDIAQNHGLKMASHFVQDKKYKIVQQGESDAAFLNKRCALEGCAFLVFDGTMVVYDEKGMEGRGSGKTLTLSDQEIFETSSKGKYGACEFWNGKHHGHYKEGEGRVFVPEFPFETESDAQANRFAKNLLRMKNKNARTGNKQMIGIDKNYVPAGLVTIQSGQAGSWDGLAFIYRVRNDYVHEKSKVFFRKIESGEK